MRDNKIKKIPSLIIKNLEINPPFILGGMGVRVTNHKLVSAVADYGMAGTIASVGLCATSCKPKDYVYESNKALIHELQLSKKNKRIIGVNVMHALTNYKELVKTASENNADYISCGAGLPLDLPELVGSSKTALIPIVSSTQVAHIILKKWIKKYSRIPDAFIVEGALAGGHLGYNQKEIYNWKESNLIETCLSIKEMINTVTDKKSKIPVIAAGGIFNGADIAKFLNAGVDGVQMSTRFIATKECDVPNKFKEAIIKSKVNDMVLINSPVGLIGRALKNEFVESVITGEKLNFSCPYHCLTTCKKNESQYCLAEALVNAQEGRFSKGLMMTGFNAHRIKKIHSVKNLINILVSETIKNLKS